MVKQQQNEPTIREAVEAHAALPGVLDSLERLSAQMDSMQREMAAMRKYGGEGEGTGGPITWSQARGRKFVKLREAAHLLGVSDRTVRRLLERGLLSASSGIRHKLVSIESLEGYGDRTTV